MKPERAEPKHKRLGIRTSAEVGNRREGAKENRDRLKQKYERTSFHRRASFPRTQLIGNTGQRAPKESKSARLGSLKRFQIRMVQAMEVIEE